MTPAQQAERIAAELRRATRPEVPAGGHDRMLEAVRAAMPPARDYLRDPRPSDRSPDAPREVV